MNASETLRHVLVPYAYEAQITVDVLNEPKTMAKIVDVDLANIPLNEIKLYTANHYVIEDRHNFTANCVTSRAKNSLPYVLRGTWQRIIYFANGQLFAGFDDCEIVEPKCQVCLVLSNFRIKRKY